MNDSTGPHSRVTAKAALVIAIAAFLLAGYNFWSRSKPNAAASTETKGGLSALVESRSGLLERLDRSNELHVGYGVYPPYTQENPNTHEVTGFSVEVINQIADELKCKVKWHRLDWNTMSADLKRGEFDVIADPIFQTIPRAREFAFTAPYAYFADGIAVVRRTDNRFDSFRSLDRTGITIAVGKGWASETLVRARLTKPTINAVVTKADLLQVFNELVSGRADAVIADGADAERFVKEQPGEFKALWLESPPAFMPAGFALRPDDRRGAEFLSVCLRNLEASGVLEALAKKHGVRIQTSAQR
ncbi:MAG: transporter substrate-binding domain-containing protein [Opitutaceae bacterium]|nr:transporter substrate-binding domain-containing protein [Opitutaceae bacterium]